MKLMKRATALLLCFLMLTNGPLNAFATEGVSDNNAAPLTTDIPDVTTGSAISSQAEVDESIVLDFLPAGLVAESESMADTTAVITANPVTLYKSLDNGAEGIEIAVESGTVIDLITKYTFTTGTGKLVFYRYDYYGSNEALNDAALSEYSGYVFIYSEDVSIENTDKPGNSESEDAIVETEKTDTATGIVLSAELPEDVTLAVTTKAIEESGLDTAVYPVDGASLFYDVKLYQGNVEYQAETGVTITFPETAITNSGLAVGDSYKVYHIHDGATDVTGPFKYTGGSISVDFANLSVVGIAEADASIDLIAQHGEATVTYLDENVVLTINSDPVTLYDGYESNVYTSEVTGTSGIEVEAFAKVSFADGFVLYQYAYYGDDADFSAVANTYQFIAESNVSSGAESEDTANQTLNGTVNGISVSVSGDMPTDISLSVSAATDVSDFDVESGNVLATLDIKLLRSDGSEWQPNENCPVVVTLDAGSMGLSDGDVIALHHKHGDTIETYDVYVVIDGKITFATDKFSIYLVESTTATTGTQITSGSTYDMVVGEASKVFYSAGLQTPTINQNGVGTCVYYVWSVTDTNSVIDYTVHNKDAGYVNNASSTYDARVAPWITVTPKRAGTVTLKMETWTQYWSAANSPSNGTKVGEETITIVVTEPAGFHVKNSIPENGCLIPTGLENVDGVTYKWTRSDGQTIQETALNDDGSVNVSKDRGGLTNSRSAITYTVTATLQDGTTKTASYEVTYSNEILNPGFEVPADAKSNWDPTWSNAYGYVTNGTPGVYWKTTTPGTAHNLGRDIEFGGSGGPHGAVPAEGNQYVELNAEGFGALYQDILTTPGASLSWSFSHTARTNSSNAVNGMYIIMGATEYAQAIVNETNIDALVDAALNTHGSDAITNTGSGFEFTYNGGTYRIWYNYADNTATTAAGWEVISGNYPVPDGQYLTRLFFATDPNANVSDKTMGNLIDAVYAGETMSYKIEYYVDGSLVNADTQTGKATVYTSVDLTNLDEYTNNGYALTAAKLELKDGDVDYPGDVTKGLYITDYGTSGDDDYAVVLKVYLAERAVTITKNIVIEGWDDLTATEKSALIGNGLTAKFNLKSDSNTYTAELTIIAVSSTGELTAMGEFVDSNGNAPVNGTYTVTESSAPSISDYTLKNTSFNEQTITITDANPTAAIICTNTYEQSTGTLVIEKTVTKAYDNDALPNDTFTFSVSDVADGTYNVIVDGVTTTASVFDGKLTFTLSNFAVGVKKTITIQGIPAGTYTVSESEDSDYISTGGGQVTVPAGGESTVSFTNEYKRHLADLTITKTGWNATDENQSYIFTVTGPNGFKMDVVINGNGSVKIKDLPIGEYTVTENTDWSWRYTPDSGKTKTITLAADEENKVNFDNSRSWIYWLSGDSYNENQFTVKTKEDEE